MSSYDFTIITPVYNGSRWIRETVDSVLQECKNLNFEYIIVNDGSSDDTLEIITEYSKQVRIESQVNQGEALAVNRGLNLSRGKYILIVSADDPMRSSELLEISKKLLDTDESIVCTYPDWSVIDSKSQVIRDVIVPEYSEKILIGEFNCIVGPGGVFRRQAGLQVGGRDSRYKFTSDYEFWLKLSRIGEFRRIPGLRAFWREHESSTSIASRGLQMGEERIAVIENFINENPGLSNEIKNMARGYSNYRASLLKYFDSSVPGKRWLFNSLCNYPKGIIEFSPKVILFIALYPISTKIISLLHSIGLLRKFPKHA